jgi:hypothetical protein
VGPKLWTLWRKVKRLALSGVELRLFGRPVAAYLLYRLRYSDISVTSHADLYSERCIAASMVRCGQLRASLLKFREKLVRQRQGIEFASLEWQLELCYLVSSSAMVDMKVTEFRKIFPFDS